MTLTERPKIARTSCRDCIFADYNRGNTQVACELGNLQKLADNGAEIISAYDDDMEFYVVENRFCNSFRPKGWELNKEDPIADMRQENAFSPDIIIYCDKDTIDDEVEKAYNAIQPSVGKSGIQYSPCSKHIILDETKIDGKQFAHRLTNDRSVYIHRILNNNGNRESIIDNLYKKFSSNYITLMNCNDRLPKNYYERMDKLLNEDMKRVVLDVKNDIITLSRFVFKMNIQYNISGESSLGTILAKHPEGLTL